MTELSLVGVPKPLLALITGPYLSGLECCDAVPRTPDASHGADLDLARARELGLAVYTDVGELPLRGATP
jgi:hypothetical protein